MNRPCLLLLVALVGAACSSAENASGQKAQLTGVARYYGFDIERITGLLEQEIDEYGCRFEISKQDFDRAVLSRAPAQAYNPNDVRAKVVFGSKTIYIDKSGVARKPGGPEFLVDKAAFVKALVAKENCDGAPSGS